MESTGEQQYQQRHNWDCGLACLMMVSQKRGLGWREEEVYGFFSECKTMVYTVDIFDFLAQRGLPCRFTTLEMGLPESHGELVRPVLLVGRGTIRRLVTLEACRQGSTGCSSAIRGTPGSSRRLFS